MLTFEDENIVRRALMRRLSTEPGVKILDVLIKDKKTHIAVGVQWEVNDKIVGISIFDLPPIFELSHVHNEADEIAESFKEARRKLLYTGTGLPDTGDQSEVFTASGTGRRGNWRVYGERTN